MLPCYPLPINLWNAPHPATLVYFSFFDFHFRFRTFLFFRDSNKKHFALFVTRLSSRPPQKNKGSIVLTLLYLFHRFSPPLSPTSPSMRSSRPSTSRRRLPTKPRRLLLLTTRMSLIKLGTPQQPTTTNPTHFSMKHLSLFSAVPCPC